MTRDLIDMAADLVAISLFIGCLLMWAAIVGVA